MSSSTLDSPGAPRVCRGWDTSGLARGLGWMFGVWIPIVYVTGVLLQGGFGSARVLVFGYAVCCIAAYTAWLVRSRRAGSADSAVAGVLAGAVLCALGFAVYIVALGLWGLLWAMRSGNSLLLMFSLMFAIPILPPLGSSVAYGLAAWHAHKARLRPVSWSLGFGLPPLFLLAGQGLVWFQVHLHTSRLVRAVDSGVPVERIDLDGLHYLSYLSGWPGLEAEIVGDDGPANERDERLAELYERLTGRTIERWYD